VIDLRQGIISYDNGEERLQFTSCVDVNHTDAEQDEIPVIIKRQLKSLLEENKGVFADPDEALPYNTSVVATIQTVDDNPVYSKLYPYPVGLSEFVNKEIKELVENGIIRPSTSPYNNPIWVVNKKGCDDQGNQKRRLVIDFRKLNLKTLDEKYPVPDINNILSNLGGATYFTKLDLKSGFHQILLREKDREKTAFSINNAKFEFCRLPFGFKNAPGIFQRAIDDVLREKIGAFVYVYIDDIIIFSKTAEDHLNHIAWVMKCLHQANMRVSSEKSEFFKPQVEYLGFIVSREGIRTCPEKVAAIKNFPEPSNLFEVRSFLGLASYYRRFIKDFATIAKSLTNILKGEHGSVSSSRSKGVKICLDEEQREAFHRLRQILSSSDVILPYPDFGKPFELTTDASAKGLGAVLSQEGKPITMISRALTEGEANFATNEREMLAIVWALKKLRGYLYGIKNLTIFTDHQPLSFAVSDKNTNAKIKRWRAFIDEHNPKIVYRPGKENHVADALSRQLINAVDNDSTSATVHSEISSTFAIRKTDKPLNCYKNQIILEEADEMNSRTFVLFRNKRRIVIRYSYIERVFDLINNAVNVNAVNAIHCDLSALAAIQDMLVRTFPTVKFWFAPKFVVDITNADEQKEILVVEHLRAHRGAQNIAETVLRDYYFPKMVRRATEIVSNCKICREAKYVRHPNRQLISPTPIPNGPGERIHVDIFSTDGKHFLTCIDKFSKFAVVQPIKSRSIVDLSSAILQLINLYPNLNAIYCDNEAALNSQSINELVGRFNVNISNTPPEHSTSNGQVERFHGTLAEIGRCLKEERMLSDTIEILLLATIEYNRTIHSVTRQKPCDVLYLDSARKGVKTLLLKAQGNVLRRSNKGRVNRTFDVGDKVFVKISKRRGNKLSIRFVERKVQADLGSTVLIRGRMVHKDNIR
jgi:ribonuclease HI